MTRFPWSPPVSGAAGEAREGGTVADPQHAANPVLITDAAMSYEQELAARKHRYKIMMGLRIPLMILAAVFYTIPWLAVTLLVLSIPLPWMAVLIANDRLPKKREDVSRFRPDRPELEQREHRVIEG
ncbi:DUF3099 domain-containing protein [Pseudonocardia hydrocarbonoxydans]|uniref:DUF3099 domain-containing protein n=1 Tax=Pseudonocardia hydrocarbonoxydans TaxID=76726 RepID=A0A4Y3WJD8_9PSEU|nr:hypothetical protein PHY01_06540 [Pseudonocardia hydrocarbonoxydans]